MRTHRSIVTPALLSVLVVQPTIAAAWAPNGTLVCNATQDQREPAVLADGAGGVFIVWTDGRPGLFQDDIYVQRLNSLGDPQFVANGVGVVGAANDQYSARIVSDQAGGIIVAWEDRRDLSGPATEIYVQRMDGRGSPQWPANGVILPAISGNQTRPAIASDGAGGAIVAWEDNRLGTCGLKDIYARRIDSDGNPLWSSTGVPVCTAQDDQDGVRVAEDGTGGAIITWSDKRTEVRDAYAQRLNDTGVPQWTANGRVISSAPDRQTEVTAVPVAGGGLLAAWNDWRSGEPAVFAQSIDGAGLGQWTANGVSAGTSPSNSAPAVIGDATGYLVAFNRGADIHVQKLTLAGAPQWGTDGVALCTAAGTQRSPQIVSDGSGGAIVTWVDFRSGNGDIYARRIDGSGVPQWAADGVALCIAAGDQERPVIADDGAAGAIVAWEDSRDGTLDIYAQRVSASGQVAPTTDVAGLPPARFRLGPPRPSPATGSVELSLALPEPAYVDVRVFDASGRRVRLLADGLALPAGTRSLTWDGLDDDGRRVPSGVYLARALAGGWYGVARVELIR